MGGGIGVIEMLDNTNILALVGGGSSPKFPLNILIIWDEDQSRVICEIRLNCYVLNVKLNRDK